MGSRPSSFALTGSGPLRFYSTTELVRLPPPTWQIEPIIPFGGLVGLYGQPGVGKSFVAIDMVMSIATGIPWHGCPVQQGQVLYVGAEGGTGIGKRVMAWLDKHDVSPHRANVAWLTESIPVHPDANEMDVLFERIEEARLQPAMVVIDTLARCFDGDENKQEDMGRFVAGVDRLRHELKATVIIVHHTRLDGDRERGNTAFRGAADAMISIKKKKGHQGQFIVANDKQKDAEEFAPLSFMLEPVEAFESCVVVPTLKAGRGAMLIAALRKEGITPGVPLTFTELQQVTGWNKMSLSRALRVTVGTGEIIKENGKYTWIGVTPGNNGDE